MTWATWTNSPLVPSIALLSIVFVLWAVEPQVVQLNFLFFLAFTSFVVSLSPERTTAVIGAFSGIFNTLVNDYHISGLFITNASMLFTGAAAVWLLHRAIQTLCRPVPELIEVLGVDVPAPPDVSLTAIGSDKATITWSRPPPNRAVEKYTIQVNGVNVGESSGSNDNFITVSGLKPSHFYNIRILAVGANNFQAGSRVLRLRTFDAEGRPRLGDGRLPSDFVAEEAASNSRQPETGSCNEDGASGLHRIVSTFGVEPEARQAGATDGQQGISPSSRRNTINRRHSPSTASLDHLQQPGGPSSAGGGGGDGRDDETGVDDAQLESLNQTYERIRNETLDVQAACLREEEESKKNLQCLDEEKKAKLQELKKKEEQTKKLQKEVNLAERAARAAITLRTSKEATLKKKTAERDRIYENIEKWGNEVRDMKEQRNSYAQKRQEDSEAAQRQAAQLRKERKEAKADLARAEAELKSKRREVNELEEERRKNPTAGDDNGRQQILAAKRQLQKQELDQRNALANEARRGEQLDSSLAALYHQMHFNNIATQPMVPPPAAIPPVATAYDYDATTAGHFKGHNGALASPAPGFAPVDGNVMPDAPAPLYYMPNTGRPPTTQAGNFVTGPFMGRSADPHESDSDEAGLKALTAGAPLSPTATSLLPSNIFADDEPSMPADYMSFVHGLGLGSAPGVHGSGDSDTASGSQESHPAFNRATGNGGNGGTSVPQSPATASQPRSLLSSPRESSQHLPFAPYGPDAVDGRPPTASTRHSPTEDPAQPVHGHTFGLFSSHRSRGNKVDVEGPALGTLKQGQSQSFPRQGDDSGTGKNRRGTLGGWMGFNRNSVGPEVVDSQALAAAQFKPKPGMFGSGLLSSFGSRSNLYTERDAGSPRPASMASSDMPRPSTDNGSIWGPPGETGSGTAVGSFLWRENMWSRNPSRRQSLHGSPSALKTNLASAEDKILDEEEMLNPETSPSQVGVIGSKPPGGSGGSGGPGGSKVNNKTLNPTAPTFMASIFRSKGDKEHKGRGRDKAKDKGRGRDKISESERGGTAGTAGSAGSDSASKARSVTPSLLMDGESPGTSRRSRDGHSVHTQVSVADSRDSLEHIVSNTGSEPNSVSLLSSSKDSSENSILKMFRKDSSVKLGLSRRIGRGKGSGSIAGSERNLSVDRSSIGDLDDVGDDLSMLSSSGRRGAPSLSLTTASVDSVTSCPMSCPTSNPSNPSNPSNSTGGSVKSRDGKSEGGKLKSPWFSMKKKSRDKDCPVSPSPSLGGHGSLGEPDSTTSSLASMASASADGDAKA